MESESHYSDMQKAKMYDLIHYFGEGWFGWDGDRGRFTRTIEAYKKRYKKKGAK